MEEEKRKKRVKQEDTVSSLSPRKNKTAYTVLLVTPTKVVYEISKDNNSVTQNIWGNQLKVGDLIYLDK